MNIESEFQSYIADAYNGQQLRDDQIRELRRGFVAGMHLAACRINQGRSAKDVILATMTFATTLLESN